MERRGFTVPLLIGGATTSEMHTAVKIAPEYSHAVIHVRDASRATGVVAALLSDEGKQPFLDTVTEKYAQLRHKHESTRAGVTYVSLDQARANRFKTEWNEFVPSKPSFTGVKYLTDYPLTEISRYIDWTFFFHAWKISGKYPVIFDDPLKGVEARKLFDDAQEMLKRMIDEQMVHANGVFGFFEANAIGDSVELSLETQKKTSLHFLRNEEEKENGIPNLSLADFIAPKESGYTDYIGLFAVTAGLGIEKWVKHFEEQNDDYNAIMVKILADRLAEAFAELLHEKVRKEYWGYAGDENLSIEAIIHEGYAGIRPAPGYPACPEHSEKGTIFDLLDANRTGITLTENYSMYPAAAVSGYYFAHPEAQYFAISRISRQQIEDYAYRKNLTIKETEKLLGSNLNY
jgi:5-methyltetrahydrofolate--homocysteine methyltransferase